MVPAFVLLLAVLPMQASGVMYDVLQKDRQPPSECLHGCALWADLASDGNTRSQKDVDAKWNQGAPPSDAGRLCAAPGNDPGAIGSWCYCRNAHSSLWGFCRSIMGMPEQINIQVADPSAVVVAFVTFEATAPKNPPLVEVEDRTFTGVTHIHRSPSSERTLFMHFVRVSGLQPRQNYSYRVRSGGAGAHFSELQTFRALYASGITRLDVFGDMGVYKWNNMGNLLKDCLDGSADAVIHIGDHAYNEGDADEQRGDGYMSMYSKVLSRCPWVPIVGNHEYYSGENLKRYMDSTWQEWNDTTSLHALLEVGSLHAAGSHGQVPSGTSRWYSVDIGLVHWISLDLNIYFGSDSSDQALKTAQAEWLKRDLAAANANRKNVPWILAGSHFPFYCSECADQLMTADWYSNGFVFDENGIEREHPPMNDSQRQHLESAKEQCKHALGDGYWLRCSRKWATDVKVSTAVAIRDLMPIIHSGGVDMYLSGHWHFYESLWPMGVPTTGAGGPPSQRSFERPNSTVHVTTGNGGPPAKDDYPNADKMQALRQKSRKYGYGRVTAFNASHLLFEQVLNGFGDEGEPGEVMDSFVIVQPSHGPFAAEQAGIVDVIV